MEEQNWREYNRTDNYENQNDPCKTCKHYHYVKPESSGGAIWGLLFVVALVACFVLFMHWQDDEEKLKNCIYYNEYDGTVHSMKNGVDNELFDSDDYRDLFTDIDSSDDWE